MAKLFSTLIISFLISTGVLAQNGHSWIKKYYTVSGDWSIENDNGESYVVLHSNFKTTKGPDLKLYLIKKDASVVGKRDEVEKYGILLGHLKSIKGNQKYLIPADISISDFKSIVVHCQKYTKVWAAASL